MEAFMASAARRIDIRDVVRHEAASEHLSQLRLPTGNSSLTDARELQGRLSAAFQPGEAANQALPRLSYRRRAAIVVGLACVPWISIFSGIYLMIA
jgi:hypothetical protein